MSLEQSPCKNSNRSKKFTPDMSECLEPTRYLLHKLRTKYVCWYKNKVNKIYIQGRSWVS